MKRRTGKVSPISVAKATVWTDFYSFTSGTGQRVDSIEDWLGTDVEAPVAAVLERLRLHEEVQDRDGPHLAAFAAAGLMRSPTLRRYMEQIDDHIGPLLLLHRAFERTGIDPVKSTVEQMNEWRHAADSAWRDRRRDQPISQASQLRTLLRKVDELTTELRSWSWTLLASQAACLITSDSSVTTFQATCMGGWSGLLPEGSPVMIPISPRHLVVGERYRLSEGRELTAEMAELVNLRSIQECWDAIYKHPDSSWPQAAMQLSATRPKLPDPTVTWARSALDADSTFPARYPDVTNATIRDLLVELAAEDVVD